jgi:hypothetical protein
LETSKIASYGVALQLVASAVGTPRPAQLSFPPAQKPLRRTAPQRARALWNGKQQARATGRLVITNLYVSGRIATKATTRGGRDPSSIATTAATGTRMNSIVLYITTLDTLNPDLTAYFRRSACAIAAPSPRQPSVFAAALHLSALSAFESARIALTFLRIRIPARLERRRDEPSRRQSTDIADSALTNTHRAGPTTSASIASASPDPGDLDNFSTSLSARARVRTLPLRRPPPPSARAGPLRGRCEDGIRGRRQ